MIKRGKKGSPVLVSSWKGHKRQRRWTVQKYVENFSKQSILRGSGMMQNKLDGVGPVDNRPSTNKLHHFKTKKIDMRQVTCDMWHVTRDTWHMTHDMRHVTWDMLWGVNIFSKFQLPSSSGLWFMIFWRLGGKGSLTHSLNEWINYGGDCRTAPATPGLLKSAWNAELLKSMM